jgi:hypothetical protein
MEFVRGKTQPGNRSWPAGGVIYARASLFAQRSTILTSWANPVKPLGQSRRASTAPVPEVALQAKAALPSFIYYCRVDDLSFVIFPANFSPNPLGPR